MVEYKKQKADLLKWGEGIMEFDLNTYMHPFWQGQTVLHEAALIVETQDGRSPNVPLLYRAERILAVRSADLQTEFQEGIDYALTEGTLQILPGSRIPRMRYEEYYPGSDNGSCKTRSNGQGFIFFTETSLMHQRQIAVSYTHSDSFGGPIPPCKQQLLPRTQARLAAGRLQLCVFGDSICVGGNSSGFLGVAPYAPIWAEMLQMKLAEKAQISFRNPSLGGKTSAWGAEVAQEAVGYGPELCIIGFGMNDGTRRIAPEEFGENIRVIMATARAGNPECEFVLVATTLPNEEVGRFLGCQEAYLPVLQALEGEGVAVADMTSFHQYLLTKKRFYDMSANNVNHPNDFLARAYAQLLWQTIIGYETDR